VYSFDTSAYINGMHDIFRVPTFQGVWDQIGELVSQGVIRSVDEVKRELQRRDDEVLGWARSQRGLFVPLSREIQAKTREVLAAHPRLIGLGGPTGRSSADPFVVALAMVHEGTVVTQEQRRSLSKPRIPDVCDALGVRCISLPEFVDEQGWTVSVQGR
jgi:hypothetical protein